MNRPTDISIASYDYPLPSERIAKYPLPQRDQSKLLHFRDGVIEEQRFSQLPDLIASGALMFFNDTKVIHARLLFQKETGASIEIFCLEPWRMPASESFAQRQHTTWLCMVGNNKKWKSGPLTTTIEAQGKNITLSAERDVAVGENWIVHFSWTGGVSFADVIEAAGVIPLPPYLHRAAELSDNERYQTIYARQEGSVAAPTAGLHFTPQVMGKMQEKGVLTEFITLQVGAGTFKPVSSELIGDHSMHVEQILLARHNMQAIIDHPNDNIIAVGTTTVRTLESAYWFGVQLALDPSLQAMEIGQWDCYDLQQHALPMRDALRRVVGWMDKRGIDTLCGATQLLIAPGYSYHVVKSLITNFHQPKSTLLLLVSALIGDRWRACYDFALSHGFRFLSYGDSCFFDAQP